METLEWTAFDRIRQFEFQLSKIKNADFIHDSTKCAIRVIEAAMTDLKSEVTEAALIKDPQYIKQKAISLNQKLFSYTNYLGILLRSTNVRNCYEAYKALSQIVTNLTGKTNQLIISSEWDASPFFIQDPPPILRDFVFIGMPAFASRNALLLPLAAHEIGHAVWRIKSVEGPVYTTADYIVTDYIESNRDDLIRAPSLFKEIDEEQIRGRIMTMVMAQAQETFCDLFGAYLFKGSFYYAFEQYLTPGFGRRETTYPSFEHRLKYIKNAAFENPKDMQSETSNSELATPNGDQHPTEVIKKSSIPDLAAADAVLERIHQGIVEIVKEILTDASLLEYSTESEKCVTECLMSGVPPQEIVSPIVILNSIWLAYRTKLDSIQDVAGRHKFKDFMNNLCMKSLEVVEFLQLGRS